MESSMESGITTGKIVTNEEFETALKDTDNIKIMRKACQPFSDILSNGERKSCQLEALWKTLQKYHDGLQIKFTTSLYNHVKWECHRQLKETKKVRKDQALSAKKSCNKIDQVMQNT
jgi:hypothetical protein